MNSIIIVMIVNLHLTFLPRNLKKVSLMKFTKVFYFKLDNDLLISNAINNIKGLFFQKKFEEMINYLNNNFRNVRIVNLVFNGKKGNFIFYYEI